MISADLPSIGTLVDRLGQRTLRREAPASNSTTTFPRESADRAVVKVPVDTTRGAVVDLVV